MITYDWKITAMEMAPSLDGLTDVITIVKFNYIGLDSDSGFEGVFNGSIPMGVPSPDGFVPLEDLTEAEVVAWVVAEYPSWEHPNEVIAKQINNQINPKTDNAPLPWAPVPDPVPPME